MTTRGGRAPAPLYLSGAALGWGLLVVSAGFWFPAYHSVEEACHSDRPLECEVVQESSSTLVATEGTGVLFALAIPVVASVLVMGLALASSRTDLARRLGWCVVGALWAASVLASASVGWYFAPSAVLLMLAVSRMHAAGTPEARVPA